MEQLSTADGATTAVRGGEGRDLFIVHSLLTDRDAFQAVLPNLTRRFRVTLVNLPGFHGTRKIPGILIAFETWLEMLSTGSASAPTASCAAMDSAARSHWHLP